MLREAREDLTKQTQQHDEEIILLNEQLHNKRDHDFIRFKEFVAQGGNPAFFGGAPSAFEVCFVSVLDRNEKMSFGEIFTSTIRFVRLENYRESESIRNARLIFTLESISF